MPRSRRRPRPLGTRRRACPRHGWTNAVLVAGTDREWVCPLCGTPALTERQYAELSYRRNAARVAGG